MSDEATDVAQFAKDSLASNIYGFHCLGNGRTLFLDRNGRRYAVEIEAQDITDGPPYTPSTGTAETTRSAPPLAFGDREHVARHLYVADHGPRWATAKKSASVADQFHVAEAYRRADVLLNS